MKNIPPKGYDHLLEKVFKLRENKTNFRTEIIAGLTTFITTAYIIQVIPTMVAKGNDLLWSGLFVATILAIVLGTLLIAFWANKPFVLAPGLGTGVYFILVTEEIANNAHMTYEQALGGSLTLVLISGILFTLLSAFGIREKIIEAIPEFIRVGLGAAIGFMLVYLGLNSTATISAGDTQVSLIYFIMNGVENCQELLGSNYALLVIYIITIFIGIVTSVVMFAKNKKGGILAGIAAASVFYWIASFILDYQPLASLQGADFLPPFTAWTQTVFFDFSPTVIFEFGLVASVIVIVVYCISDMFNSIGVFLAAWGKLPKDPDGNFPQMKEALLSDSTAAMSGAFLGVPTITAFAESAAGIEEGGRTGLTAVVIALCFLLCLFIEPIIQIIPAPATSSALIIAGVAMLSCLKQLNYKKIQEIVPVTLMIIVTTVATDIGSGIGIGLISYTLIMLLSGQIKKVSFLTIFLSILFVGKFFIAI